MRYLLIMLALVFSQTVLAEKNYVTVPGEGWHLVIDMPPLTSSEGRTDGGRFSYTGADNVSGLTFSVNTEPMKEGTNKSCRDVYWAKAQANPYIVKDSSALFDTPALAGVSYRSEGDYKGQHFTTANAHAYFIEKGNCVDLHVSQIPFSAAGKAKVESIVRTAKASK